MSRRLQDELRAAAEESDEYSLLRKAADALDRAERAHVEAWETEDAVDVVWGTHDPVVAFEVCRDYFQANCDDGDLHPTIQQWHDEASKRWARPDLRHMEEWPETAHGPLPVEGWTPYLVLAL